jgi:hypothetical protein
MVECFSHTWGWVPKELGKTVFFVVAGEAALTGTPRLSALVRAAQARITEVGSTVAGTRRRRKPRTRGQARRAAATAQVLVCTESLS